MSTIERELSKSGSFLSNTNAHLKCYGSGVTFNAEAWRKRMGVGELAIAVKILQQPLNDIYSLGKEKFLTSVSKWSNGRNTKTLANKVASFERVKTIWQREKEVKLGDFYFPSKVCFPGGNKKTVNSIRDINVSQPIVIEGTVGQGKSVFLRYLCIQELSKFSSGRIPIFVELRKIESAYDLKRAIFDAFESLGFEISEDLFELYSRSGKIVLLLDAFDELELNMVRSTINQLECWCERFNELLIIITSRPGAEIQKSNHFKVLKLAPLASEDHKPFLIKIGVKDPSLTSLLKEIKDSSSQVSGLLSTPLLLTLLAILYASEQSIPKELPDFFEALFFTVFSRHDRTKPGFARKHLSGLNERKLERLFEAFCFNVVQSGLTTSLSAEQFADTFKLSLRFFSEKCDESNFYHDIVKIACLMQEEGFHIVFIHKSLLDYYAAAFVKHCTDPQAQQFYSSLLEAIDRLSPWRAILQFLSQIDTYRYAKYFGIPGITYTLHRNGLSEISNSQDQLNSACISFLGRYYISFDEKKNLRIVLGSFQDANHFSDDIFDSVIYSLTSYIRKFEDRKIVSMMHDTLSDSSVAKENSKSFTGTKAYRLCDALVLCPDILNETFKPKVDELINKRKALVEFVTSEDSKVKLLINPFTNAPHLWTE